MDISSFLFGGARRKTPEQYERSRSVIENLLGGIGLGSAPNFAAGVAANGLNRGVARGDRPPSEPDPRRFDRSLPPSEPHPQRFDRSLPPEPARWPQVSETWLAPRGDVPSAEPNPQRFGGNDVPSPEPDHRRFGRSDVLLPQQGTGSVPEIAEASSWPYMPQFQPPARWPQVSETWVAPQGDLPPSEPDPRRFDRSFPPEPARWPKFSETWLSPQGDVLPPAGPQESLEMLEMAGKGPWPIGQGEFPPPPIPWQGSTDMPEMAGKGPWPIGRGEFPPPPISWRGSTDAPIIAGSAPKQDKPAASPPSFNGSVEDDNRANQDAIAEIESRGSGDYSAVGPNHPKYGRALGRYQMMEANIPGWSKAALGREVSADEFLANPELQDQIFNHRFNSYVRRYGLEGAAQAWLGGSGSVGKTDRKDVLGTSVGEYGRKFMKARGQGKARAQ